MQHIMQQDGKIVASLEKVKLISELKEKSSREMFLSVLKIIEKWYAASLFVLILKTKNSFSLKYKSASIIFLYLLCFSLSKKKTR